VLDLLIAFASFSSTCFISSSLLADNTAISFPNALISLLYCSQVFLLVIGALIVWLIISDRGMRFLYEFIIFGCSLSASSSTLLATPIVIGFLHAGQIFLTALLSLGDIVIPQFLCPSKWYFPSSGKYSSVSVLFSFIAFMSSA